jgi:hypothetical protein
MLRPVRGTGPTLSNGMVIILNIEFRFEQVSACSGNRPYMIILRGDGDGGGRLILHFTASLRSLRINLPPPAKGKNVKNQKLRCPGEAKAQVVVPAARGVVEANR